MADISDRIKELRRANGMTQDELAKILSVTRSAVGMYEQGVRRPDFEHMDALADIFNVSLDYLMGKTDTNSGYPRHVIESSIPRPMLLRQVEQRAQAYFKGMTAAQAAQSEKLEKTHRQILEAYDDALPPVKAAVLRLLDIESEG